VFDTLWVLMSTAMSRTDDPIREMDAWHCRISFGQRQLFRLIAEVERRMP